MNYSRPRVDPYVQAVERMLAPLRAPMPKNPAARRAQEAAEDVTTNERLGTNPPHVATWEQTLTVPGHPDVRLRVYWPTAERPAASAQGGLPILVAFYGGAFTIAGIDWVGWDAMFRQRAKDAGIIIVAGDYSHAPEVRFPAQPEQCWTVFEWAWAHAAELGGDPERLAVGGASSGGNLAAATALMNRDRNNRPIRLQLLENPVLDLTMEHVDPQGLGASIPGVIVRKMGVRLLRQYLGRRRKTRHHPYASPLRAPSLAGLPPAMIYTAELDPLRGDGEAYARALLAAGVPATAVRGISQTHSSGGLVRHVPSADWQHRDVVATLRTLHEEPVSYPNPEETK